MLSGLPDPDQLLVGALAFLRIGAIIFALPITGDSPTPVRVRGMMSLAITIAIFPVLPRSFAPSMSLAAFDVITVGVMVLRELVIGMVVGFLARLAFDGLLMAASVTSYQMGFGTANLFLPDAGAQMDAFTAFHRQVIMLIFLTLGMHQIFFEAIADTFRLIPAGGAIITGPLLTVMVTTTAGIFSIALQLAAPILVALLFTMAALGLVARTVPQMNVFQMSFPFSFFLGLTVYIATMPFFPEWMREHFTESREVLTAAVRALAP